MCERSFENMNWLKTRLSQDYKIYKNYARKKKTKGLETLFLKILLAKKKQVLL
jgi:hypothetical protein